jgi:p-cumate 2,3-dioxygenase beta subunit
MSAEPRTNGAGAPAESLQRELEQFLYAEAELLDSWQIEAWFQLFTDDCTYWVPQNADTHDPATAPSLILDSHTELEDRMLRLLSPLVYTQTPRARTRRLVSNVRVGRADAGEVQVFSNFLLYEVRLDRERVLGGQAEHILRREIGGWRIRYKRVSLLSNNSPTGSITLLL